MNQRMKITKMVCLLLHLLILIFFIFVVLFYVIHLLLTISIMLFNVIFCFQYAGLIVFTDGNITQKTGNLSLSTFF